MSAIRCLNKTVISCFVLFFMLGAFSAQSRHNTLDAGDREFQGAPIDKHQLALSQRDQSSLDSQGRILSIDLPETKVSSIHDVFRDIHKRNVGCTDIPVPPRVLETYSKYDQSDRSRSVINAAAHSERKRIVQPIRNSVRAITVLAQRVSANGEQSRQHMDCLLRNMDRWAMAGALTAMKTSDAVLSRDRWVAEIALVLAQLKQRYDFGPKRSALYKDWLHSIAQSTVDAYSYRLGPKSKTNNHRYWAGLAVAAIGVFSDDETFSRWGWRSFEIGACQVDKNGYLPLELARGSRALEYHLYALRPLAALYNLRNDFRSTVEFQCFDGFERLRDATLRSLQNPNAFENYAGVRQVVKNNERSFSAPLRRRALGI